MKILYITSHSPWPQNLGLRIRSGNIVQILARRHQVIVALLTESDAEIALFDEGLMGNCEKQVIRAGKAGTVGVFGRGVERYRHVLRKSRAGIFREGLAALIERENPDLLWFFRLNTVWEAGGNLVTIPTICDMDDFESAAYARRIAQLPLSKRWIGMVDFARFSRSQSRVVRNCQVVLLANPLDEIKTKDLGVPVATLPNGFDFSQRPLFGTRSGTTILFFGLLKYPPNMKGLEWFINAVWPHIILAVPEARIEIAGDYRGMEACVEKLSNHPGITFRGFVDNLDELIARAVCLVVPLQMGGGTRIKILEAWARGLPVVSTSVGCEGLGAVHEENLLIADLPAQLAEACVEILCNPQKGVRLAQQAYEYARRRFDWNALESGVQEIVSRTTTGVGVVPVSLQKG